MRAIAQTDYGVFAIDLETEEVEPARSVDLPGRDETRQLPCLPGPVTLPP